MKKIYILYLLICLTSILNAQQLQMRMVGNATIKISDGTTTKIDGNFRLFNSSKVENDGLIEVHGSFINSGTSQGFINRNNKGELYLKEGNSPTVIAGSSPIYFEKLTLDNTQNINNIVDFFVKNELELINGKILSTNNLITIQNDDGNGIIGFNEDCYIIGELQQYIVNNKTYHFPIGTINEYEPAILDIYNIGTSNFVKAKFIENTLIPPSNLMLDGTKIFEFLDYGYWHFENSNSSNTLFDITLTSNGHSNGGEDAEQHALFRRTNTIWENAGTHTNSTQSGNFTNTIVAQRTNVQGLGDFIIGKGEYSVATNPILHQDFEFINAFQYDSDLKVKFVGVEDVKYKIHLIDLNGRIIESQQTKYSLIDKEITFNVSNLITNIYLVTITSEGFVFTKQILIKN